MHMAAAGMHAILYTRSACDEAVHTVPLHAAQVSTATQHTRLRHTCQKRLGTHLGPGSSIPALQTRYQCTGRCRCRFRFPDLCPSQCLSRSPGQWSRGTPCWPRFLHKC